MLFPTKIYQLFFGNSQKLIPTDSKKNGVKKLAHTNSRKKDNADTKMKNKNPENEQSKTELIEDISETMLLPVDESLHNNQKKIVPAKIIKSEVNFKRWPYFSLSKKGAKKSPQPYRDTIKTKDGELKVFWKVVIASEYGCPSPFDKKVHRAIEQIINEIGWPVQRLIPFSFYQLCKILKISENSGWRIQDIKKSLKRMVVTTIDASGTFYQKDKGKFLSEKTFHLYNGVYFKKDSLPDGNVAETNYVELGQFYLESLNAHYVKPIDFNFYQELKNEIACRLFEILGLQFYGLNGRPAKFEYQKLCALLPVNPQRYFFEAKKKLQPAHDRLIAKNFLKKVEWIKQYKNNWQVIYYPTPEAIKKIFTDKSQTKKLQEPIEVKPEPSELNVNIQKPPAQERPQEPEKAKQEIEQPPPPQPEPNNPLIAELLKRGIKKYRVRQVLADYQKKYPDGDLLDILECFDHKDKQGEYTTSKNRAGILVRLIESNDCEAKGYKTRAERAKVKQVYEKRKATAQNQQDTEEKYYSYKKQQLDNFKSNLQPDELKTLRQQYEPIFEEKNPFLQTRIDEANPNSMAYQTRETGFNEWLIQQGKVKVLPLKDWKRQ